MTQSPSQFSRSPTQTPSRRDSPIRWALNALRLNGKYVGSAIVNQERDGSIFFFVRKGEATSWVPFHKVMTQAQLQGWIGSGGFPRDSGTARAR